jgi:hypothetical protein
VQIVENASDLAFVGNRLFFSGGDTDITGTNRGVEVWAVDP